MKKSLAPAMGLISVGLIGTFMMLGNASPALGPRPTQPCSGVVLTYTASPAPTLTRPAWLTGTAPATPTLVTPLATWRTGTPIGGRK
jgi:hypothetical protein